MLRLLILLCLCGGQAILPVTVFAQAASPVFYQAVSWSPDGKTILVSARTNGGWAIYEVATDGRVVRRLQLPGEAMDGVFSPDGKRIAFSAKVDGNTDIYVVPRAGGAVTRLTFDPKRDSYPTWSPDGKSIAFNSERSGKFQIWTMRWNGADQQRAFASDGNDWNPSWGRGGVAYDSDRHGKADEIYIGTKRITTSDAADVFPRWTRAGKLLWASAGRIVLEGRALTEGFYAAMSPDGKQLAVIRGGWPASELLLMRADGTNERVLLGSQATLGQ